MYRDKETKLKNIMNMIVIGGLLMGLGRGEEEMGLIESEQYLNLLHLFVKIA
jgi:hypothetical protein